MNARTPELDQAQIVPEFQQCLDAQRAAYMAHPEPGYAERKADLQQLARLLKDNRQALVEAICKDYGNRSEFETLFAEYFVVLETIQDNIKNLKKWMRPQRRHIDILMFPGASNRVVPQPLGVVGVIVPWNFPLFLSFGPMASIMAAGNRVMVKMSENSQALTELLKTVSPKYFPRASCASSKTAAAVARPFRRCPSTTCCSPVRVPPAAP